MEAAFDVYPLLEAMATKGNPNSVSDAGVGALAADAAVHGAYLNVRINAAGLKDRDAALRLTSKAKEIAELSTARKDSIINIVNNIIDK